MDIRVLGPVEVHNGHKLAIGGPRQRRILAALAMHAGDVVSLDRLADITWSGEQLPEQADTNVRTYVYRVRSGLGESLDDRIETATNGYRLVAAPDELDYRRFERQVERADRVAEQGDAASALAYADEALGMWRGHPYEEFEGEPWVEAEISRLNELRARALERRCDALIQLDRADEAVAALEAMIGEHPFRERPRRLLMLALYNAGRQAEAIRSFQDFRSMLVEEAGIVPSDELAELERRILEQDPGLRSETRARSLRSYELDDVVGEGAFAMVWRGTQPVLGREVAVKQVRSKLANDPDFIRRFEVEAQLVASLEHPYIVPLYDYWREPDAAFLVMRLLRGGTLDDRMTSHPLDDAELRRLIEQVGSALSTAHRNGVIHRDVKPANILLDGEGNYYLSDFGIAFGVEGEDDAAAALSTGSPPYASPEQLKRQHLDPRSDIYAFGVTLYAAAVGRAPYAEETTRAGLLRRQLEEEIPPPSRENADVPSWLDDIVRRTTARLPAERFLTVDDLMAAVRDSAVDHQAEVGLPPAIALSPMGALRNPFKGLRAFQEADVGDFQGRKRLVARFLDVLRRPGSGGRLVAAVGPSGSGKSSAVRAGLIPALRAGAIAGSERWFITTMMPGVHPFEELESALARIASAPPGPLADRMASDARGITRAVEQILPDDDSELLLVIDQFEELFTMSTSTDDSRRFLDGLLTAIKRSSARLRVVITIRADLWDRPLLHPVLAPILESAVVTVSPLGPDELEEAIVGPVQRQGIEYEPGLVARITADVLDQPGALPLLQYTLTELFERNVASVILASAYDELGGVTGALVARAEELYASLGDEEQVALRRVFGRLVTLGEGTEDTRRRVTLAELGDDEVTAGVIAALGNTRLVTFDRDPVTRGPTVEIAHEALLREWPRLRSWIDEDRESLRIHRHLTTAAADWNEAGRDDDELYRGARLDGAVTLRDLDPSRLNDREAAFVAASHTRSEAEAVRRRRRTRVLQGALAATAVLAVVAVVAGLLAFDRAREAEQNRDDLAAELLAASVVETAMADPIVGSLLAAELYELDPSSRSLDAVARALLAQPGWLGGVQASWVQTSAHGPWIVTGSDDSIILRDPDDLSPIRRISIEPGPTEFSPAMSPDGRHVVIGQPDGPVIVDLDTGAQGPPLALNVVEGGHPISWTHDGAHLLAAEGPSTIQLLEVAGLEAFRRASIDMGVEMLAPWIETHPTEPTAAIALSGTVVLIDTAEAGQGRLAESNRFDLTDETFFGGVVRWGDDGTLYTPTFGGKADAIVNGSPTRLEALPTSERRVWSEPLGDGTLFVSDFGGDAMLVDPVSGRVLAGPWSPSGAGTYSRPVEIAGGDILALFHDIDGAIHLFSRSGGNLLGETLPEIPGVEGATFYLPDDSVVALETTVWTFSNGRAEEVDLGRGELSSINVSPTVGGPRVVAVDKLGQATVHDLPSGAMIAGPIDVGSGDAKGYVTPDDERLVVQVPTGLIVLDAVSGIERASFEHGSDFSSWSRVRGSLATVQGGIQSTDLLVVNHETLEVVRRGGLNASNFTPDGRGMFTPTEAGVFSIVDMATDEITWSAPGVFGGFDPTGKYVITEWDAVQFYEHISGEAIGPRVPGPTTLHTEIGALTQVREGRIHLWNIDPTSWPAVACEAAGRNLTRSEWDTHMPPGIPYEPTCEQWPRDS